MKMDMSVLIQLIIVALTLSLSCVVAFPNNIFSELVRLRRDLDEKQKSEIVNRHNALRAKEGANNMELMTWDDNLQSSAKTWAEGCVHEHPDNLAQLGIGQNLYARTVKTINLTRGVDYWYDEKQFYTYDSQQCAAGEECGHYQQVVWANSRHVGCAVQHCKPLKNLPEPSEGSEGMLFVCDYRPPGNYLNQHPYTKGPACSKCSSGAGWCKDKLCNSNCASAGVECSCAAHCYNCGTLNIDTCRCKCANGWRGVDCSMRMYSKPDAVEGLCPPVYGPGAHTPTTTASAQSTFIVAQQAMITVLMVLVVLVINHNTATDQI